MEAHEHLHIADLFECVFDTSPNWIYVKDSSGKFLLVNDAYADSLCMTREELVGLDDSHIHRPEKLKQFQDEENWVLERLRVLRIPPEPIHLGGQTRWLQTQKMPLMHNGEPTGKLLGITTDVTDLVLARQRAEGADKAKSAFLATMSHEIKTPMHAILGNSECIAEMEEAPENMREIARDIHKSGGQLLGIVDQILELASIEAGMIVIVNDWFNPSLVVESLIHTYRTKVSKKGLTIGFENRCPEALEVFMDVEKMENILIILFDNAIKFTHEGEINLMMYSVDIPNTDKQDLCFVLRDEGIGLSEDEVEHIFEPFRQLEEYSTRKYEGIGLGLAIARKLAKFMGGDVQAKSEQGKGATFFLSLRSPRPEK